MHVQLILFYLSAKWQINDDDDDDDNDDDDDVTCSSWGFNEHGLQ